MSGNGVRSWRNYKVLQINIWFSGPYSALYTKCNAVLFMPKECGIVEITAMKVPNFVAIRKLNLFIASANNMAGTTHTRVFNTTWLFSGRTLFGFNRKDNEKNVYKESWKKNICMVPCANYFVNWLFTKCLIQCMQLNAIYLGNLYFFQVVRNITFMISSHVWRMWFYTKMEERKKEKKKKIFFRPLQVDTTNNTSVCYLYPLNIVISKSFLQNKNNLHWENVAKEPVASGGFLKVSPTATFLSCLTFMRSVCASKWYNNWLSWECKERRLSHFWKISK